MNDQPCTQVSVIWYGLGRIGIHGLGLAILGRRKEQMTNTVEHVLIYLSGRYMSGGDLRGRLTDCDVLYCGSVFLT